MAFTIEKTVRGSIYVYEVVSLWDKEKKKSIKKYTYLGRKSGQGGLVEPKRTHQAPRHAEDFGARYLIDELIGKLGIKKLLLEAFPDVAEVICKVVAFQVIYGKPSYLMEYFSSVEETSPQLTSQNLSVLFRNIGTASTRVRAFVDSWINMHRSQDGMFYDLTSFSSYSRQNELVEWGYNRDGEDLPQINFGILYGSSSQLPLMYRVYQGSISDVTTLANIHKELTAYDIKNFTFYLDRGFFSAQNLSKMATAPYDVVMPMPFSTSEAKKLSVESISDFSNMINVDNSAIYCKTFETQIGGNKFYATVFQTEKRRVSEFDNFTKEFEECELKAHKQAPASESDMHRTLESFPSHIKKCFVITPSEGAFMLTRNSTEIETITSRMGKMILVTKTRPVDCKALLLNYRSRDMVEKAFDVMKNELNEGRLRVASSEAAEGRLFVNFLALIVTSKLRNVTRASGMKINYTISEILCEVNKIKRVTLFDGSHCLTEVSKRQKDIFRTLGIDLPKL